jgi:hypothetical protein
MTTRVTSHKNQIITKAKASKILGRTPYMEGFHFYTAIGNYIEETATSLTDFANILTRIDEGSIRFHFQRQDFQKWIRAIIGDYELADRLDKIKATLTPEELRRSLIETVQTRITELEKIVQQKSSS